MTTTPEREALIRETWRRSKPRGSRWIGDYGGSVCLVEGMTFTSERFEYRNGAPWRRVVCEGVSVEEWPLQ